MHINNLCKEIQITNACCDHASGIVDLFNNNYENKYHYEFFTSCEKLIEVLNSDNFKGWVVLSGDDKVIGFSGVYVERRGLLRFIKLAHLLVDKNSRGIGAGEALESVRERYYSSLEEENIVIVSCVEKPIYSIELKRKRGFGFFGVRLNYRPEGNLSRTNSVLMGLLNLRFTSNSTNEIEEPSRMTKNLISYCCKSNRIERKFDDPKKDFLCDYKIILHKDLGRAIGMVSYQKDGVPIKKVIDDIGKTAYPYIAICMDAQCDGFADADNVLTSNGFVPLAFIPCYSNGNDLIEYQFLHSEIDYEKVSTYTEEFLGYIFKSNKT